MRADHVDEMAGHIELVVGFIERGVQSEERFSGNGHRIERASRVRVERQFGGVLGDDKDVGDTMGRAVSSESFGSFVSGEKAKDAIVLLEIVFVFQQVEFLVDLVEIDEEEFGAQEQESQDISSRYCFLDWNW